MKKRVEVFNNSNNRNNIIFFCFLSGSFPGLWEMPLVDYYDKKGELCNFVVTCTPPDTVEEVIELFDSNFQKHYTTNRAPFFMLLAPEWLHNSTYFEGKLYMLYESEIKQNSFHAILPLLVALLTILDISCMFSCLAPLAYISRLHCHQLHVFQRFTSVTGKGFGCA